jgi:predicted component of type VI protein secretion system
MKLSLVVLTAGKMQGKTIPVTVAQFLIGRDPECQLRPASPMISKKHCALMVQDGKVFARDFGSTNGTFVNDRQFRGEFELHNGDRLKAGPLEFRVNIETATSVEKPTPLPPTKAGAAPPSNSQTEDEDACSLLLAMQDEGAPVPGSPGVDSEGVPTGSTIMDSILPPDPSPPADKPPDKPAEASKPPKPKSGDTAVAAKSILDKYWRRPRS